MDMKNFVLVLFAGAMLATVAFAQENGGNNAPPAEQKQAQTADKCCGKDCCKHISAKKDKASKQDKSAAGNCCK
jgi:uncharacterized protein YdeI (BOF family)